MEWTNYLVPINTLGALCPLFLSKLFFLPCSTLSIILLSLFCWCPLAGSLFFLSFFPLTAKSSAALFILCSSLPSSFTYLASVLPGWWRDWRSSRFPSPGETHNPAETLATEGQREGGKDWDERWEEEPGRRQVSMLWTLLTYWPLNCKPLMSIWLCLNWLWHWNFYPNTGEEIIYI